LSYLACVENIDFWNIYSIQVFLPLILCAALLAFAGLKQFLINRKNRHVVKASFKSVADPFERAYSLLLLYLTSLFTLIVSVAFSPFRCYLQIDGSYTLIPKPSENCFDGVWLSHIWVIILALLFIGIVPFAIFYRLRSYKGNFKSNQFLWRYGLLTDVYKEKYYYWELMSMFRKTLIVIFVDLLSNYSKFGSVG
jgi:hypothetical protein